MKLYSIHADKIGEYKTIDTPDGTMYPDKLTDAQLNSYGYYKVEYQSQPNRRYYTTTETKSVVGAKYVIGYTAVPRPIEEVKQAMLKDLSEIYVEKKVRPKVPTSLGFDVDGGYSDIVNFETAKQFSLPEIKDADNNKQPVTLAEYDTIINEIKLNGLGLFNTKDGKETEIKAFTTVVECETYEHQPYDYIITQEDVNNDVEGALVVGQVITKYKNNVKEW